MTKVKRKRNRGVVLATAGLEKLQKARLASEQESNFGERYTYEQLGELTNLDVNTIKRILSGREGVDRRSLEKFFLGFGLKPNDSFYTKPRLNQRQDWGEAVAVDFFFGRVDELNTLSHWLLKEHCRTIALLGMGGMGKTTLSIKLAKQIAHEYDCVIWKSLRDAPPIDDLITYLLEFLSEGKGSRHSLSLGLSDRITQLIQSLRAERCLIVLDNAESLMDANSRAGKYRQGYQDYGELLQRISASQHRSSLILTTREKPQEIAVLEGDNLPVRSLQLRGLKEGQEIIKVKGLSASEAELTALKNRYDGNPLALKMVSATIEDLFAGSIAEFLRQDRAVFGDIRDLLDRQFERLSALEQEIMYWLAIAREPLSLLALQSNFVVQTSSIKLLEALESLSRRSLIEKNGRLFTQQSVVMEYLTERLVENISREIAEDRPQLLRSYALIQATAKDYIRENQIRLILQPVIEQLLSVFRSQLNVVQQLNRVLLGLQQTPAIETSYGAGNIINLLSHLKIDLTGYDFSNLCVWQADLRNARLHKVNFHNANLEKSVFAENFGGIWSVAFSPNGEYIAAGDTKGSIIWRRVADGLAVRRFEGHNGWVVSLACSPDGKTLASSSCDCKVKLWDIQTGKCLHSLKQHEEVWSVAFSPDGKLLASGCDDCQVRLWDVETGKCLHVFSGHSSEVLAIAFSWDGQTLISGSQDSTIRFWNLKTLSCRKIIDGHEDGVRAISLSPDGKTLASSSNDRTVRLWEIKTGKCLQVFRGHKNVVFTVAFSPQGNLLASSGIGQKIRLWEIETGKCLKVLFGHSNLVNSIAFNPQGSVLASGSYDQSLKFWDLDTYQCLKTWKGHSNQALAVVFSPDGQTLVSGGYDRQIRLWDLKTGAIVKTLSQHSNRVLTVAFCPSIADRIASGSGDRTIKIWDLKTGRAIKTLSGHEAAVRAIAFSSDGKTLVSGSEDRTIGLWDVDSGKIRQFIRGHQAEVWSVALDSEGQILASASFDRTVKLWDVGTGECLRTLSGHESWVWSAIFSPDNKTLVSTSVDRTIRFWNVETGECQCVLQDDVGNTQLIAFSPDGQLLATCNQDLNIKLWNIQEKKFTQILQGHTALIKSIAFSLDSRFLVSSSEDETIKLWDYRNGKCLKTLKPKNPYEEMNIQGVTGLSKSALETLKILGAKAI